MSVREKSCPRPTVSSGSGTVPARRGRSRWDVVVASGFATGRRAPGSRWRTVLASGFIDNPAAGTDR